MPYIKVQITNEPETTAEMKAEAIRGVTEVVVRVFGKDPETTFVVIEEVETEDWGIGGEAVSVRRARRST